MPQADTDDAVSAADRLMYAAELRGKDNHVVQLHAGRSTGVEATGAETGTTAASGETSYEVRHL
jgi:hypothetical protein